MGVAKLGDLDRTPTAWGWTVAWRLRGWKRQTKRPHGWIVAQAEYIGADGLGRVRARVERLQYVM